MLPLARLKNTIITLSKGSLRARHGREICRLCPPTGGCRVFATVIKTVRLGQVWAFNNIVIVNKRRYGVQYAPPAPPPSGHPSSRTNDRRPPLCWRLAQRSPITDLPTRRTAPVPGRHTIQSTAVPNARADTNLSRRCYSTLPVCPQITQLSLVREGKWNTDNTLNILLY